MSIATEQYTKVFHRFDRVCKVPAAMKNILKVGDLVKRTAKTKVISSTGVELAVTSSYTKFHHWGE